MKQVIILLFVILSLSTFSCDSETIYEIPKQTDLVTSVKEDGIIYTLSIPTTRFWLADTLIGNFEVFNTTSRNKTYHFNNIQQLTYRLIAEDGTIVLYAPSIVSPALSSFMLRPGAKKRFEIRTPFRNNYDQIIPEGNFTLESYLRDNQSPSLKLFIEVYAISI